VTACLAFVACATEPEIRTSKRRGSDSALTKKRKKKKKKQKVVAERPADDGDAPPEDEVTITEDTEIEPDPPDQAPKKRSEKPPKKKPEVVAAKVRKPKPEPKPEPEPIAEEDIPEIELDTPAQDEPAFRPKQKTKAKAKPREVEPTAATAGDVIEMNVEEDDPLKEPRVAAIPVPGVDDDTEEDEPEPEALPPGTWPLQIGDRPLVLAKDKLAVHGGLRVSTLTLETMPGVKTSSTSESFVLGGTYGIGEKAEVGFDYALGLSPGTLKGPFTLHGAYRAVAKPKLEVAIAAALAFDFAEITNAATMTTTTQSSVALQLGAWARYRVSRKASVFTGVPATPAQPVGLSKLAFALPPLPYQLALGINNAGTRALELPIGLGYQATPNVYAFGMLNLAHIRLQNTANAFLFADFIPLALGGFYTRKTVDVGVLFSDDLKQGTDYLRLDLLLRYAIK